MWERLLSQLLCFQPATVSGCSACRHMQPLRRLTKAPTHVNRPKVKQTCNDSGTRLHGEILRLDSAAAKLAFHDASLTKPACQAPLKIDAAHLRSNNNGSATSAPAREGQQHPPLHHVLASCQVHPLS